MKDSCDTIRSDSCDTVRINSCDTVRYDSGDTVRNDEKLLPYEKQIQQKTIMLNRNYGITSLCKRASYT